MNANLIGKKHPYYRKSMSTNFPRFSTQDGFCRIFPEISFSGFSHSMGFPAHAFLIWWSIRQDGNPMEKTTHFIEKVWGQISQWEIWWENPCIFHAMKYIIGWESNRKKHPYCGKSMSTNFPGSAHRMGFLGFYREPIFHFLHWMGLAVFSHVMGN